MPYQPPSIRQSLPPRPPSTSEIPNPLKRPPDTSPPSSKRPRMDDHASNEPQRIRSDGAAPYTLSNPQNSQPQRVRFDIRPVARFQGQSATIKRPREIAHFSYDDEHEYKEDDSGINYYCPPTLGSDFREGFDTFKHYEDKEDPHLDSLLKTIISKEKKEGTKVETDFVTWRGMMTKIMTAPYDMFAAFDMLATLHDGTIYIQEDFAAKEADRAAETNNPRPNHKPNPNQASREMMTFWGYKFETLSLLPTPPRETDRSIIEQRPNAIVSNHAQHCSIVKTAFDSNSLVLGGEVDGLWEPKSSDPNKPIPWIELKTSEQLPRNPSHHDILRFERKLLKFWAQSFLLGVEKVIVGFRTKQGILTTVDVYDTARIPGMVRRGTACWDGNACINFAASVLSFLKKVITGEGVWRIKLEKKGDAIQAWKVEESGTGGIISQEFLDWRNRDKKSDGREEKEKEASLETSDKV